MKAVILAAGIGSRLGDLTKDKPKCLIEINGKSLLENQIDILEAVGIKRDDIVVVIGNEGECWTDENRTRIREINDDIVINERNDDSSNSYSLRLAMDNVDDDLLVIDGDLAFPYELIARIVKDDRNLILTKASFNREETRNKIRYIDSEKVLEMAKYLPRDSLPFPYIVYGCLIKVNKKDLDIFKRILSQKKYDQKALNHLVNEFCKEVNLYKITDQNWININNQNELEQAKELFEKNFVVMMSGYTAVGKSTTAQKIAKVSNTDIYHSAIIRKEMDLSPKTVEEADKFFDWSTGLRQKVDKKVYGRLAEKGLESLKVGKNAVLDAGYFFEWQRQLVYDNFKSKDFDVVMVRVVCSNEDEVKERIRIRAENFQSSPLNETPSWNVYLATKKVTEQADSDSEYGRLIIIEYNTLNNQITVVNGDQKSKNCIKIIRAIKDTLR
jgi:choline kinase/predicted kinase